MRPLGWVGILGWTCVASALWVGGDLWRGQSFDVSHIWMSLVIVFGGNELLKAARYLDRLEDRVAYLEQMTGYDRRVAARQQGLDD
jgi:hypothetical protein